MNLCSIASGSSGNCICAGTDQTTVLVDAGISCKRICEGLKGIDRKPEEIDAIVITHEHSDHIQGLGVLSRKYKIPVYCSPGTRHRMLSANLLGKVDSELFHTVPADEDFQVKDLTIHPFRVSHDAAQPYAYKFYCGSKTAAVATDLGYYDNYIVDQLRDLDVLLLESNHDVNMLQVGVYPYYLKQRILGLKGHLSNESAGRLLSDILHDHTKHILLGHLSKENNYEALAYATVCAEITMGDNPYKADDFPIQIASRDVPSEMIRW